MRTSGILYPVSSLPSKYGIGCFSKEAYEFVDFLKKAGQTYWQVLPFGPTGYGDSPYQSFSTFAGNPYFIDLETLIEEGLLERWECDSRNFGTDPESVDYGALYENRFAVLALANERFQKTAAEDADYQAFRKEETGWLDDYSLFMALKQHFEGKSWTDWDLPYRNRDKKALDAVREVLKDKIDFFCFQQYEFAKQWKKLHTYANEQGIRIIGDIPIYVAFDSADTWSRPELFQFDEDNNPKAVAGCPPDAFSATGQLWGNPLYDWPYHRKTGYQWWIARMKRTYSFYDVIRVDHFRGFDEYYAIPADAETALTGEWIDGPGMDLFNAIRAELGHLEVIAEDLGIITPSVRALLKESGFPGMKVLQFAFDGREDSDYLPHNVIPNCVIYTGTHDNETTRGWIESRNDHDRDYVRRYINSLYSDYGQFTWDFIRTAQASVADTCIIPIQDYLVVGNEGRINQPATQGANWKWRVRPNFLSEELGRAIFEMSKLYHRIPALEKEKEDESGFVKFSHRKKTKKAAKKAVK